MFEFAGDVQAVRYMVSYEQFPIVGGEYELSKAQDVVDYLADRISEAFPHTVGRVWCDHPEYNPFPDFELEFRDDASLTDEERADRTREVMEQIEYRWLPEAIEAAGIDFDADEGEG